MLDVLQAMRGEPGESVKLLLRHADEEHPQTKELVREVIMVDSVIGDRRAADGHWEFRLEQDPRIAQIRHTTFGNKTTFELERVLDQLTKDGIQGVVLDLAFFAGAAFDRLCPQFWLPASGSPPTVPATGTKLPSPGQPKPNDVVTPSAYVNRAVIPKPFWMFVAVTAFAFPIV